MNNGMNFKHGQVTYRQGKHATEFLSSERSAFKGKFSRFSHLFMKRDPHEMFNSLLTIRPAHSDPTSRAEILLKLVDYTPDTNEKIELYSRAAKLFSDDRCHLRAALAAAKASGYCNEIGKEMEFNLITLKQIKTILESKDCSESHKSAAKGMLTALIYKMSDVPDYLTTRLSQLHEAQKRFHIGSEGQAELQKKPRCSRSIPKAHKCRYWDCRALKRKTEQL